MNKRLMVLTGYLLFGSGMIYASQPHEQTFLQAFKGGDYDKVKQFVEKDPTLRNSEALIHQIGLALFNKDHSKQCKDLLTYFLHCGPGWTMLDDTYEWPKEKEIKSLVEAKEKACLGLQVSTFKNALRTVFVELHDELLNAIEKSDVATCERLVQKQPALIKHPEWMKLKTSALHKAAEKYSQKNLDSILIFARLIRLGARVDACDSSDLTVYEYIKKHNPEAEATFTYEDAARQEQLMPDVALFLDQGWQLLSQTMGFLKPYKRECLIGSAGTFIVGYWLLSGSSESTIIVPAHIALTKMKI